MLCSRWKSGRMKISARHTAGTGGCRDRRSGWKRRAYEDHTQVMLLAAKVRRGQHVGKFAVCSGSLGRWSSGIGWHSIYFRAARLRWRSATVRSWVTT